MTNERNPKQPLETKRAKEPLETLRYIKNPEEL